MCIQVCSLNLDTREAEAIHEHQNSRQRCKTQPCVEFNLEVRGDATNQSHKKLGECNVCLSDVKVCPPLVHLSAAQLSAR